MTSSTDNNSTANTSSTAVAAADARYTFDDAKLAELRKANPWKDDPRYFKGVAVGPSAVMKMVSYGWIYLLVEFCLFCTNERCSQSFAGCCEQYYILV